jgi:hypothetical protein
MIYNEYRGGEQMSEQRQRKGGEVVEPKCSGCGMDLLSYLSQPTAEGQQCLRCGTLNKTEENMSKSKVAKAPEAEVREVKVNGEVVKMRFSDQSQECTHWWRLTGNKGVCKKCGVTRVFGKTEQATEEIREKVLAYVKAHSGKKVEWAAFAKEVGLSQGRLGSLLRALIDGGAVIEVDHDNRPFVYRLARPKVARRVA